MATAAQLRVDPRVGEEAIIREKIAEVPLPAGVKFKSLEPMTEWTGEDAWEITFVVAKELRLTKRLIRQLGDVHRAIEELVLPLKLGKWPFVNFVEGR